jgi:hypothetical protein
MRSVVHDRAVAELAKQPPLGKIEKVVGREQARAGGLPLVPA